MIATGPPAAILPTLSYRPNGGLDDAKAAFRAA
jgi:hypothetical protein